MGKSAGLAASGVTTRRGGESGGGGGVTDGRGAETGGGRLKKTAREGS